MTKKIILKATLTERRWTPRTNSAVWPGPIRKLHYVVHRFNSVCLHLSMIAIVVAAIVLTSSVALRYWLKIPTDWQDEMSVFLIVGAIFGCSAYVQSDRGHVGIEAVAELLSPKFNAFRQFLCDVLSCAFCAFFSWKSWTLLHEALKDGMTTSSTWAPPLWIPYGLMAFGMTLMTLQILLQVIDYFYQTTEE